MSKNTNGKALGASAIHFLHDLGHLIGTVAVTDARGKILTAEHGLQRAVDLMRERCGQHGKILFVGNGGSAAIASHMATDMWKCGKLSAMAFNDSSLLTCVGNDFGYEHLFAVPVTQFGDKADILVAISSSGRSPNILGAVGAARQHGMAVIGLSGFDADNPLRSLGDINFHVPSHVYGLVEVTHLALLHSMLDAHMGYPHAAAPLTKKHGGDPRI